MLIPHICKFIDANIWIIISFDQSSDYRLLLTYRALAKRAVLCIEASVCLVFQLRAGRFSSILSEHIKDWAVAAVALSKKQKSLCIEYA